MQQIPLYNVSPILNCIIFLSNYEVCAGDLDTDAALLEQHLTEITLLGHKWKAIILLDEADVFLEQRETQNIHRNRLVSVSLRDLEYFQGIMSLITNRVTTFDEAFQSRIHFAIHRDFPQSEAESSIPNVK